MARGRLRPPVRLTFAYEGDIITSRAQCPEKQACGLPHFLAMRVPPGHGPGGQAETGWGTGESAREGPSRGGGHGGSMATPRDGGVPRA